MPDSQNPEHSRKLIEEFQLKGTNLIPTVTAEIVPTVLVADLTAVGPVSDDRLCWGGQIGAASGAGNQNTWSLINPPGSGTLLILEQIFIITPADDTFDLAIVSGPGSGAVTSFRDDRLTGTPVAETLVSAVAAAVLGPITIRVRADESRPFGLTMVIEPNRFLRIRQTAQNTTGAITYLWRERDVAPGS